MQLQADNPDLQFVVPESGATTFVDTMVIPYTTKNQSAAEAWINYIYDRANYAKLVAFVQYVPVLSDMTEELEKIDPAAAKQSADQSVEGNPGQSQRAGRRCPTSRLWNTTLVRSSHRRLTGWQV